VEKKEDEKIQESTEEDPLRRTVITTTRPLPPGKKKKILTTRDLPPDLPNYHNVKKEKNR